jgi:hypothetical protein
MLWEREEEEEEKRGGDRIQIDDRGREEIN